MKYVQRLKEAIGFSKSFDKNKSLKLKDIQRLIESKQFVTAVSECERVIKVLSENKDITHTEKLYLKEVEKLLSIAYVKVSDVYFGKTEILKAYHSAKLAARADPENWQAYHNMGMYCWIKGHFMFAKRMFLHSLKIKVNEFSLTGLSSVYIDEKDYGKALRYATEALQVNKYFAPAYGNLGVAKTYLGDVDKGIDCLREAVRLNRYLRGVRMSLSSLVRNYERIKEHFKAHTRGYAAGTVAAIVAGVLVMPGQENKSIDAYVAKAMPSQTISDTAPGISKAYEKLKDMVDMSAHAGGESEYEQLLKSTISRYVQEGDHMDVNKKEVAIEYIKKFGSSLEALKTVSKHPLTSEQRENLSAAFNNYGLSLIKYREKGSDKDYQKAKEMFHISYSINPKNIAPLRNLGFHYYKREKDFRKAKEYYDWVLKIDSEDRAAKFFQGKCLKKLN